MGLRECLVQLQRPSRGSFRGLNSLRISNLILEQGKPGIGQTGKCQSKVGVLCNCLVEIADCLFLDWRRFRSLAKEKQSSQIEIVGFGISGPAGQSIRKLESQCSRDGVRDVTLNVKGVFELPIIICGP